MKYNKIVGLKVERLDRNQDAEALKGRSKSKEKPVRPAGRSETGQEE